MGEEVEYLVSQVRVLKVDEGFFQGLVDALDEQRDNSLEMAELVRVV